MSKPLRYLIYFFLIASAVFFVIIFNLNLNQVENQTNISSEAVIEPEPIPQPIDYSYIDTELIDKQENKVLDPKIKQPIPMTWAELNDYVVQVNRYVADKQLHTFKNITKENSILKQINDSMRKDAIVK